MNYVTRPLIITSVAGLSTSPPPIEKKVSWGSCAKDVRWFYTPLPQPPIFPTTYRDEVLVGKLASETSPPPIEKRVSWGSSQGVRWLCPPSSTLRWHAVASVARLGRRRCSARGAHRRRCTGHCAHARDGSPVSAIRALALNAAPSPRCAGASRCCAACHCTI